MAFADEIQTAPTVPVFNVGATFDISTGYPVRGQKGETITLGGFNHLMGGTGEANSAKTGTALYMILTVLERYPGVSCTALDAESTLSIERIVNQARNIAPSRLSKVVDANGVENEVVKGFVITNHSRYTGEEFFNMFKKYGENRPKKKENYVDTPFKDANTGDTIRILMPDIAFIDSFSKMNVGPVQDMQDEYEAGDKKQNRVWLEDGRVKAQILMELPAIIHKYGLYYYLTAQIVEDKQLDPYKPMSSQLSFLKNGMKLYRVPSDYRYNLHGLWFNFKMKNFANQDTKAPQYPKSPAENKDRGSQDLQEIIIVNLRNKGGVSGEPVSILYSQSEGLLANLTEFHFCKTHKFGISGNNQEYYMDLYPDVKLTRTTVRSKLKENKKLAQAVTLTSDLLQIQQEWTNHIPASFHCTPKELYEDLIAKGYDWDVLLESRNYWTFDQYTNPVPFLSAMDLLYMREGTYVPYWLKDKK